ncbi:AAA family ATPase [Fluviicola taffensis]|uniref:AAA family ATPase n=1 Tax=Fluviicola taffensis TaxID=191579 RepID=UPI00313794F6
MSEFKLIAIRPLLDCDQRFRKNLKEGMPYKFYQDYKLKVKAKKDDLNQDFNKLVELTKENYLDYSSSEIELIETPSNELNLYSDEDQLQINISAIVGKNGSGKSSLIELFFASVFNIGIQCEILYNTDTDQLFSQDSKHKDLNVEIIYKLDDRIYKLIVSDSVSIKTFKSDGKVESGKSHILKKKDVNKLFYSISINYSIYGLNSSEFGMDWIRHLFHKNDGYQTPLVINPMRIDGNIRIETENYLAKTRLISNLIDPNQDIYNIGEGKIVDSVGFNLNYEKIKILDKFQPNDFHFSDGQISIDQFIENNKLVGIDILNEVYEFFKISKSTNAKFKNEVDKYLVKKLYSICKTYEDYTPFLEAHIETKSYNGLPYIRPHFKDFSSLLDKVEKDGSHITLKIKQVINYLIFEPLKESEEIKWEKQSITFPLDKLKVRIKTILKKNPELQVIELIPPSLFFYDMTFEKEGLRDSPSKSTFNLLSSGEQQYIHSLQSIIYHVINLSSISNKPVTSSRQSYHNINLILDEVELYFHPEFQRTFINNLHKALNKLNLKNKKNSLGINAINILFSTHSPFILSDIPASNILKLIEGVPQPQTNQTFAANIYDILKDDFFLSKGVIGEFAKGTINKILFKLNNLIELRDEKTRNSELIESQTIELEQSNTLNIIQQLGDIIIKKKMLEMYDLAIGSKNNRKEIIEQEINRLQQELNRLK